MKIITIIATVVACLNAGAFDVSTPFKWRVEENRDKITVAVEIPAQHYLYAESTNIKAVNSKNAALKKIVSPVKTFHEDQFSGKVEVYQGGQTAVWVFAADSIAPYRIEVQSQGCRDATDVENAVCFMPEEHIFKLGSHDGNDGNRSAGAAEPGAKSLELDALFKQLNLFQERRSAAGYLNSDQFMAFMNNDNNPVEDDLLSGKSVWLVIMLIIAGGLGLNFTPCVLPMIPVNLAIIGAGTGAASKKRGFLLGGAYGLGIALAYGILGLSVVVAGAQFGALNSTVWFNFAIAIVFLILALAMFDVINIDLSRFGISSGPTDKQRGKFFTAFVMGIIAALLAGACVAPVVIAVLLYSSKIYGDGSWIGLALPFLLGIGMGLPWPFAGAGMAVIPKPGKWMVRIKQFFGVIIMLAAAYYGYIAFSLMDFSNAAGQGSGRQISKLQMAVTEAEQRNVPLLIDFWATWCKNCSAMDSTTFLDPQVKQRLNDFVFVKFQAENLNDPDVAAITDYFKVKGLPTYVILKKTTK